MSLQTFVCTVDEQPPADSLRILGIEPFRLLTRTIAACHDVAALRQPSIAEQQDAFVVLVAVEDPPRHAKFAGTQIPTDPMHGSRIRRQMNDDGRNHLNDLADLSAVFIDDGLLPSILVILIVILYGSHCCHPGESWAETIP